MTIKENFQKFSQINPQQIQHVWYDVSYHIDL